MKLWDLLKRDHQEVEKLFAQMEKSKDKESSEKLFTKIKSELQLHTKLEETHFYPALKKHDATKNLVKEALEEHGEVKKMLTRLSSLTAGGDKFMELVKELQTNVEHHVEEEEQEIFPAAEKAIDKQELDTIAGEIQKEKQAAKAG
ncbi:MAG: hemerythrin domain-containing protein [Alphaproteobacteria bacterium]|nr:hemerythrin domain-containing protein [Alphaproteobacteria bacterium]